jgi:predicted phosphodiesterase
MRIAVLSDIHGNLPALEAVTADLKLRTPDLTVNLGDCVSGPLWPRETCELLMAKTWPTIRGNCDRAVGREPRATMRHSDAIAYDRLDDRHRSWLGGLLNPHFVAENIFACHGTPTDDDDYLADDITGGLLSAPAPAAIAARLGKIAAPLTLYGHSHVPRIVQSSDGRTVLNPGSVGLPAYDGEWNGETYFAESGSPHARYALVTKRNAGFDMELIAIGYNFEFAAQKAETEGRADYAKALRTGTMR